ncbi:hypothetical protein LENED_005571 [Lentinula edodes]|uniref:Uncharacterized protein n=1 Tax=Lentinula edodes TaxID=5353 RepID=A0A1Q3E9L3_LENED|nr:hypothetical protein LENED_005571 [Lentinula edodes]
MFTRSLGLSFCSLLLPDDSQWRKSSQILKNIAPWLYMIPELFKDWTFPFIVEATRTSALPLWHRPTATEE